MAAVDVIYLNGIGPPGAGSCVLIMSQHWLMSVSVHLPCRLFTLLPASLHIATEVTLD